MRFYVFRIDEGNERIISEIGDMGVELDIRQIMNEV